ncbi:hypothetical protein WICPIJ_001283 [Wickerhamomyces pijperi]|uniref:Uncharacterized protein n=1 Tax=Wickerhamomyces pijperi TaxID=599730 RepID=A0A9P8QDU8_WICPI|nr:hypothetical protein WICPIJ_001283 [Wickerhamomyces pijperi]
MFEDLKSEWTNLHSFIIVKPSIKSLAKDHHNVEPIAKSVRLSRFLSMEYDNNLKSESRHEDIRQGRTSLLFSSALNLFEEGNPLRIKLSKSTTDEPEVASNPAENWEGNISHSGESISSMDRSYSFILCSERLMLLSFICSGDRITGEAGGLNLSMVLTGGVLNIETGMSRDESVSWC